MNLSSTTDGNRRVVTVNESRIDAAVALTFKEQMRTETESGPDTVILDLQQVQFVDSSGLGAIVAAMKTMGKGRTLALAGLNPTVSKVFQLTRMDSVFQLFPTLDDALDSLDA
ncbi:anti-sigma factor antagonist [Aliishimia ponticola]|uniref:Anti-sigma factor antagonist n=1 Tax=Aliishimia ponticola TaxID=2499833 RepID=A0A4S4NB88_9RHOB|nr:STAS domain-containing protein [Aliishimia ponticola]THH36642.1 anti-sigma factor antagonist [Aliishimia ponticola]